MSGDAAFAFTTVFTAILVVVMHFVGFASKLEALVALFALCFLHFAKTAVDCLRAIERRMVAAKTEADEREVV